MSNLKKLVTVRCGNGHEFDIGDPWGNIKKAGYHPCPQKGCLRNGFVVEDYWRAKITPGHTEDDMQHLDDPGEICDKCGQAINQNIGFMGILEDDQIQKDPRVTTWRERQEKKKS